MNRLRRLIFVVAVSAVSLLSRCASDPVAGGSGSEVESVVFGTVVDIDGTKLHGAKVFLTNASAYGNDAHVDGYVQKTDSSGTFRFDRVRSGDYLLTAGLGVIRNRAGMNRVHVATDSDNVDIGVTTLSPTTSLSGDVLSGEGQAIAGRVFVLGTDYQTRTNGEGGFRFDSIPSGYHFLSVLPDDLLLARRDFAVAPGQTLSPLIVFGQKVLTVEDFDDGDAQTNIGPLTGGGWWYAIDDGERGGNSRILPDGIYTRFTEALVTDGAYQDRSLAVRFEIDETLPVHYALVGFTLGNDAVDYRSLAKMDSVVFHAKGTGTIRVEFQTRTSLEELGDWGHFGAEIPLRTEWTRHAVAAEAIEPLPGTQAAELEVSWDIVSHEVAYVNFASSSDTEFMIDELQFVGMVLGDL